MPKFKIEVAYSYRTYMKTDVTVEADTKEQAEELALGTVEDNGVGDESWEMFEPFDNDGEYFIRDTQEVKI